MNTEAQEYEVTIQNSQKLLLFPHKITKITIKIN